LMVYAANGIFRGLQKVRITLIAAVGGAVVNTALDVLFVIVLNWGIAGSGVATARAGAARRRRQLATRFSTACPRTMTTRKWP
ncbi:hypothetical protein PCJ52_28710, partial [Klebsiella pneumoniae]|nr:hypothetical protein [Klebsiella pneumoniae]